ncbi:Alpha-glucan water dikinase, chloroplastic [Linum perenne]
MYSPEQEKDEYEAGRDELLEEVARGSSIDDLRVKLTSKNDTSEIKELPPRKTPVQMFLSSQRRKSCASAIEEQVDDTILNKKIFKLGDKEILVFVSKPAGKIKVHLVTNLEESTILHWASAKQPGECQMITGNELRN